MNILIVNDEILTAETMKADIPWERMGIDLVYTAYDAASAKILIGEKDIQIILLDIEMPGENGMSLLGWIRENQYDIECIFLTCHANFEYAREAIGLGCQDYIVMPADNQVITDGVSRVAKRICQKQDHRRYERIGKEFIMEKKKALDEKNMEKHKCEDVISQICTYIMNHIDDPEISVNDIADKFYFHPVYLNRIFRKEKGISVGQFIMNQRMDIAISLLMNKNLSVTDVSEKVGYKNYTNFHSIFKKRYGCSPTRYREVYMK